jgi:hypothetical protein
MNLYIQGDAGLKDKEVTVKDDSGQSANVFEYETCLEDNNF